MKRAIVIVDHGSRQRPPPTPSWAALAHALQARAGAQAAGVLGAPGGSKCEPSLPRALDERVSQGAQRGDRAAPVPGPGTARHAGHPLELLDAARQRHPGAMSELGEVLGPAALLAEPTPRGDAAGSADTGPSKGGRIR